MPDLLVGPAVGDQAVAPRLEVQLAHEATNYFNEVYNERRVVRPQVEQRGVQSLRDQKDVHGVARARVVEGDEGFRLAQSPDRYREAHIHRHSLNDAPGRGTPGDPEQKAA